MFSRQDLLLSLLALGFTVANGGCETAPGRQATVAPRVALPRHSDPPASVPARPTAVAQTVVPAQAGPAVTGQRPAGEVPPAQAQSPGVPISQPPAQITPVSQGMGGPEMNLPAASTGSNSLQTDRRLAEPGRPVTPAPAVGDTPAAALHRLHLRAAESYAGMNSYIVRLRRREQVNGKDQPEEIIKLMFRRQPWSVHLKWVGTEGNGREVVFVKGGFEGKIHTLLAPTDRFLFGGNVVALLPDSPLVRTRSRHPITEAGIGPLIDRFGQLVPLQGRLQYVGMQKRPEYEAPLETVVQLVPPNLEATMPQGGRRWWFFDAASGFPVLIITRDASDHEVEYYCYDRFIIDPPLVAEDFDPNRLGKEQSSRRARDRSVPRPSRNDQ